MTDKETAKKVRVRFAPSPTGYLHIGNFRTALYGYLFAKKNNGDFILRIEDTDQKRQKSDALKRLIKLINWAGFDYSEGVYLENGKIVERGAFGPYIQSARLKIYQKYAEKLINLGKAYYCFCTEERLNEMRNQQIAEKKPPMYDRTCLNLSQNEIRKRIGAGEKYVIRQKMETAGVTEYHDLIRQKVIIKNELLDDQVLIKSDGYPTYNFANVIDDHLMQITHVFRGEEYVSSTPKYIQLYNSFGWSVPEFVHLPLLLNPDRSKLSKRQGDVAVEDYISKGYLKEAIINFVALLGWNPGEGSTQEFFSLKELIEKFDLSHIHKGGAVFDLKKLDWLNGKYIREKSDTELFALSRPTLVEYLERNGWSFNDDLLKKIISVEKMRLKNLAEITGNIDFYFQLFSFDKEMARWKGMGDKELKKSLQKALETLTEISEFDFENKIKLEEKLLTMVGEKRGEYLFPLRYALTRVGKSPSPFEVLWILGKKESLNRLKLAIESLGG